MIMGFRDKLESGNFVITAEVTPPKGSDLAQLHDDIGYLQGVVDAINVTDNQRAIMRMCPLAVSAIVKNAGCEPIMQLTCRDRNRMALQSDLLGAAGLGIENISIMTGDHPLLGDIPSAKPVYDLDSVQLLQLAGSLQAGVDFSGNALKGAPSFFVGAVSGIDLSGAKLLKFKKKIQTGARFFQTQAVYDVDMFMDFMQMASGINAELNGKQDVKQDIKILAGIIPLKSARMARFMNENVPGITVPEHYIERMEKGGAKEGLVIASEIVSRIRDVCNGVHIMTLGSCEKVPEIVDLIGNRPHHN